MARILAIDPGPEQSAWLLYDQTRVVASGIEPNLPVLVRFQQRAWHDDEITNLLVPIDAVVFEQIENFGMAVGRETFETVFWTGRFLRMGDAVRRRPWTRLPRRTVKLHVCHSARATDANVRMALLDRWGGKDAAIGTRKAPGPLYGLKSHLWAALALAITYHDAHGAQQMGVQR
jgi:hypothetical protein